jgi:hypothetical protein
MSGVALVTHAPQAKQLRSLPACCHAACLPVYEYRGWAGAARCTACCSLQPAAAAAAAAACSSPLTARATERNGRERTCKPTHFHVPLFRCHLRPRSPQLLRGDRPYCSSTRGVAYPQGRPSALTGPIPPDRASRAAVACVRSWGLFLVPPATSTAPQQLGGGLAWKRGEPGREGRYQGGKCPHR